MGHECMEMSNAVAAVNCYRRAVDINERDFRAWYALGQAYEILGMDGYAMWYFHKVRMFVVFVIFFSFLDPPFFLFFNKRLVL